MKKTNTQLTAFEADGDGEVPPSLHQLSAHLQRVGQVDTSCQTGGIQAQGSLVVTPRLHDAFLMAIVHKHIAAGNKTIQEEGFELQALGESGHCFLQASQSVKKAKN